MDKNNPNSQIDKQDEVSRLAQVTTEETTGPNVDPAYDGWGGCWAGDGSGMDDLADYNQNEAMDYCNE